MATALAILLSGVTAFADPPPKRPADSTYFNISFQAQEALLRADRQAAAADWPAAARALQEIGEKFGDSVIADRSSAEPDMGAPPRRYISIRDFVNRKISAWPTEGLAAYRAAFEPAAKKILVDLREDASIEARVRLSDRFYATSAGATALDEAAERAIEAGEFDAARRWYDRLLADHPDRADRALLWKAKLALCRAWQGDAAPLERLLDEGTRRPEPPAPRSTNSAFLERLRAALDECRRDDAPASAAARPDQLGGAADRRGCFPSTASTEARWWRFAAFGRLLTDQITEGYESRLARIEAYNRALAGGRMLACQPVAAAPLRPLDPSATVPLIFVHDARSVWAVQPQSPDRPLWQFDISPVLPTPAPWTTDESAPPLYTSLYSRGRLYVHLEHEVTNDTSEQVSTASTLVCLDAAEGRLLWRNDLEGFVSPFEEARLDGAPLLHDDALYAVARRRKPFGFEACYLLRIDPDDGRLVWSVHLGEAATGSYGYTRATLTLPAAKGDLVFVPTNLGGVTAVSTCTGRVVWACPYDSRFGANPDALWPDVASRPLRSWHYNSAIIWKDTIVCMPLDADDLLVLSCDDGRVIQKLPTESLHRPHTLVGLSADLLYTAGTQVVCYDLAARKIAWQRPLEHGQLFGRGALTTSGLFLPTDRGLLRYPLDGGPTRFYRWSIEEAGNLLALPDQIVVAAPSTLFGLVAKEDAFVRLDQRMKDHPDDPLIAFALAELAFNTREYQRGLDAVQSAVERAGGFARVTDDALRRRFFKTLTLFATTLLESEPDDEPSAPNPSSLQRLRAAIVLLTLAGQCAPEPADQVGQRLMLARAFLESGNPAGAVRTYQQILSDRGLRRLKLELRPVMKPGSLQTDDEIGADEPPAEIAPTIASWIARIIAKHGDEVYVPVVRQAADRLTIAKASGDAEALLEVADAFPNSPAAQQALVAHAGLMEDRRDWPAAIRSYRRALASSLPERPALIRDYADCLVSAGRTADAAAWLDRGARDYPDYRFAPPSPRPLSFADYRRQLFGERRFCDPSQAVTLGPIVDTYRRLNPDRVSILEPVFPDLPETRWDALLTYSGRQLEARHPVTGRSLWSKPFASAGQPVLIGMDAARYVFASQYRLFALTRTSGQLAWHVGEEPPEDANADPESLISYAHYFMTPERLFASTDRGVLNCIDVKTGRIVWENKTGNPPSGPLVADDQHCCYGVWQAGDHAITVLDARTGGLVRHLKSDDKGPAQALLLTADVDAPGLLMVRTASIERIDPAGGRSVWKIALSERFVAATLQLDADGLIVSADNRRLARYDLSDGRVLWRSRPLVDPAAALWCRRSGGVVYAASENALFALDTDDGRTLWTTQCPAALTLQPPRLVMDRIVTIAPDSPSTSKKRPRGAGPDRADDEALQYRVHAFQLDTGKPAPLGPGRLGSEIRRGEKLDEESGTILTEPVSSIGGLFVRDNALILLDGNRLIGYVAKNGE